MRQRRWVEFLQEFTFDINYKPGKENVAADALSRRAHLCATSTVSISIEDEIKKNILMDPEFQPILTKVQANDCPLNYHIFGGKLLFKGKTCIPQVMRQQIMKEAHETPLAAHPGYHKMLASLRKNFFWPKMKKDVLDFAKRCLVCQKAKAERVKLPGLLQPHDIPKMKWQCISMDFITKLPKVIGGYDAIFVVVDKLTKVAHLIPIRETYTASDVAKIFVKEVVRLHGIPSKIISDRDSKFTSRFWTSIFESLGTQLNLSTAYHPETDGQTERVNQVIEDMLRSYCSQQPKLWIKYLPLVEFAYNSSYHRSLGMSPFKALYGQECFTPLKLASPDLIIPAAQNYLQEMDQQLDIIKQNLKRAKDRQKSYADQHRSIREFQEKEMVFLRVKPKRSSLKLGKFKKLSFRYCGPYEIIKKVGDQAYELNLPLHLGIHRVFHVSLLKKYHPDPSHVLKDDEVILVSQEEFQTEPEAILEEREKRLRNRILREVLVQWKGYPPEEASWEDFKVVSNHFPTFFAEDSSIS